ncbi:MAG: ABC-F family ATP-binding cassette domain-containing protein [Lachnospiraceae bacterium]|nr:ABC-F family ATP-binding cassette domain-containing protein [Lachnospiraceae bacterium]
MLYEIKNGTVSLGGNEILSHFNFRMVANEKIGIVGRNGAGKTTLLKLLNGEIELDYNDDNTRGEIVKSKDFNPGYLRQQLAGAESGRMISAPTRDDRMSSTAHNERVTSPTVYSYLLEAFNKLIEMEQRIEKLTSELAENYDEKKAVELNSLIDTYNFEGGHIYIKELKTGFKKFGFSEEDLERPISEFSGGQSTKISLLKLLLSKPDVLMLDEPTNHLDIEAIEWMENYLQDYKKNIVVVSHDRMFLDNICNVIYDVENKETVRYDGNYTNFVEQKEINYQLKLAEYNKNLKEIERLTALADRFRYKATKAKMVQSKDKVIEKLEAKTFKPTEADTKTFHVKIVPKKVGGKEVLRCTDLVVGYDKGAIAKINLVVNRGDRLAVIGANGTGKSTFIKTIVGVIPKISGEYSYGHEIEYEYFDQRIAENNSTKTLFDDFSDEFPTYDNTEVRNRLGRFLFGEEDIIKRVCDLSGGEKVRLCLAKIFERKPNLLILDEPTNHLDILGKESLEEVINNFEGTVIFVSHDRYFVKKISTKILLFEERAFTKFFEFGYEDYEKYVKENELSGMKDAADDNIHTKVNLETTDKETQGKQSYKESKQKSKDDKKIKKLEEEIAKLEKKLEELNLRLQDSSIQSNFEELSLVQKEIDEKNAAIMERYDMWDKLQ